MSLVQGAEGQLLEFLSSCEARLETSWNAVYGNLRSSLVVNFCKGVVDGAGTDPTGQFEWTGDLQSTGECKLVKKYKDKHSVIHEGNYNSEDNAIVGKWHVPGTKASGSFTFTLNIPDIQVAADKETALEQAETQDTRVAVKSYKKTREKLLRTPLGSSPDETLTYWTALYVYGSGRSDTVKDILIKVKGDKLYGKGTDDVGEFTWEGVFEDGKRVVLSKKYAGKHEIRHTGNYTPEANVFKGAWTIPGTRACGGFQMSEHIASRALTSALDIRPTSAQPPASSSSSLEGPISDATCADTTWGALYVYGSGRNDKLKDCVLTFQDGVITGTGEDDLAKFTWSGTIGADNKVVLHKKYKGKHEIVHEGAYKHDDNTIRGEFNVPGTRAIGVFHLTEKPALRRRANPNRTCGVHKLSEKAVCEYTGLYQYKSGRSDEISGIVLTIDATGSVDGSGKDNIGTFSWFGKVSHTDSSAKLVKQYTGKHAVTHVGQVDVDNDVTNIVGTWSIAGTKATGKFTLVEKVESRKLPSSDGKKRRKKRAESAVTNRSSSSAANGGDKDTGAAAEAAPEVVSLGKDVTSRKTVKSTWKGWCEMGKRRDDMKDFLLEFNETAVSGGGEDAVGEFTWSGKFDPTSGVITLTKEYKGMHSMLFEGTYAHKSNSIVGTWQMPGTRAKGAFELTEVTAKRA